ncbi:hypothetical protein PMAYCL1PPCAC_02420, partial [Pristionchus mayeri]
MGYSRCLEEAQGWNGRALSRKGGALLAGTGLVHLGTPCGIRCSHHRLPATFLSECHESVDNSTAEDHSRSEDRIEFDADEDGDDAHYSEKGSLVPVLPALRELGDSLDEVNEHATEGSLQGNRETTRHTLEKHGEYTLGIEGDQTEDSEEDRHESTHDAQSLRHETNPPGEVGIGIVLRLHLILHSRGSRTHDGERTGY